MKRKENWIEETLNSLDGIQKAVPGAAFQKQVLERTSLAYQSGPKLVPRWVLKAAATVLILISLNFLTGIIVSSGEETNGTSDISTENILDYLTPSEL
jgi:hypothetical protein